MRLRLAYRRDSPRWYDLYLTAQHLEPHKQILSPERVRGSIRVEWDELVALVYSQDLRHLSALGFSYRHQPASDKRIGPWLAHVHARTTCWVVATPTGIWTMTMLVADRKLVVCYGPHFSHGLEHYLSHPLYENASSPLIPHHLGFTSAEEIWHMFCDDPSVLAALVALQSA